MSVRIGINPLTWTNDDLPELGADIPLETCLSEGREAGFAGFELGQKFPRSPEILGPILDAHGLLLVSGWYSSKLLERSAAEEIAALQPHLHLLKTLGARVMVFAEVSGCIHGLRDVPLSQRPVMNDSQWQLFGERLGEVADYLQEQGVRMAYHHHMGTVVESEADVSRMMESTSSSVGLLLDGGHLTYAGGDPINIARRWAARIVHVHCKDVRLDVLAQRKAIDSSFLDAVLEGVFTVPGDGGVNYADVFAVLADAQYQGWLVVEAEQDPAKAHPLTYARLGYRNLSALAKQAGLIAG